MRTFLPDLRHAFRNLFNAPGFTLVAALTLAIGIGANTAIFSVIDAVLLRPLPFRNPGELVRLYETEAAPGTYPFAGADFTDWKNQNGTFQDMAVFAWPGGMNVSGGERPEYLIAVRTAANFFSVLGVEPVAGRTWVAGEDQPGKNDAVVLSYAVWKSRFGGDRRAIGRTIELDSRKRTIVGVMPPEFRYPSAAQIWTLLDGSSRGLGQRGSHWLNAIGRLKPGVSVKTAQADLALIASRLEKQFPDSNHKVGAVVMPLRDDLVGKSRDSLLIVLAAVGVVLLIACVNVANLLLSRAMARQKEMAVRCAMGASRFRLLRQLLTESLVLAVLGGTVGLLLGWGVIQVFSQAKGAAVPRFSVIRLDGTVLAFTYVLSIATGVLFGIFPALQTSRPDMFEELKGGAGKSISPGRRRRFTSNALVVCELALSVVLLASAGLLLKDLSRLRNTDVGVRREGVWTAAIRLPAANYATPRKEFEFGEALLERARRIPGVNAASLSDRLPLEGGSNYYAHVRGRVFTPMSGPLVEMHAVCPEYFRAMGIRLLKGRVFTPADVQAAVALNERVREFRASGARPTPEVTNAVIVPAVINESMARSFWPSQDPLGQMFSSGSVNGPWRQVIGVVSDVRQRGLTQKPVPEAYDSIGGGSQVFLVLHTTVTPSAVTAEMRRALGEIDRGLPLVSVRTMEEVVDENARGHRFISVLIASFAGLAALLAAIGIYGVLSYAVTQRTREIGIRMALGASRGRVLGEVLAEGGRVALIGFVLGTGGAIAAGRILRSILYEVKPGDPIVLAAITGLLAVVSLAACYVPARRAAGLDPNNALRYE